MITKDENGIPHGALDRLAQFAGKNGTSPERLLDDDGAFSDELLHYCAQTGLSLDWLWFGDREIEATKAQIDRARTEDGVW